MADIFYCVMLRKVFGPSFFLLSASVGGRGERLSPDEAQSGGASFEGLRERAPKDFPLSDKLPVDSAKVALGKKLVSEKPSPTWISRRAAASLS